MTCANCKAPIRLICPCETCKSDFNSSAYCHVCCEMHAVVSKRRWFTDAHNEWVRNNNDLRKRTGLEGN